MMMIPVIGTAVVANTKWVKRLYESIDFPVENFFVINNSGNSEITAELEELRRLDNKQVLNLHITHLPSNLGVASAWNLIIKSFLMKHYWVIVNDDVAFTSGFLEEMYSKAKQQDVGIVHGYGGDFGDGAWDLFLIKDFVINEFGLFDENLYPAYCEDADYIMRTHNRVKKINQLEHKYLHGDGYGDEYYTHGSQTKKTSVELSQKLELVNLTNFEYMNKKWGKGWRWTDPYSSPFNNSSLDSRTNTFDLEFIRKKYLGF